MTQRQFIRRKEWFVIILVAFGIINICWNHRIIITTQKLTTTSTTSTTDYIIEGHNMTTSLNTTTTVFSDIEFPKDCSWKCYLRQNIYPIVNFNEWNESLALEHYRKHYDVVSNKYLDCTCKVVFLAGPHKTASSTIQSIAVKYGKMENVPWLWDLKKGSGLKAFAFHFLKPWVKEVLEKNGNNIRDGFDYHSIRHYNIHHNNIHHNDIQHFSSWVETYKNQFSDHYDQGYNIIFGGEDFDKITNPNFDDSLIQYVLDIVPKEVIKNGNFKTLLTYRSPRIDHVKSLWKQLKKIYRKKDMTFYDFICDERQYFLNRFEAIDSLALTQKLLSKGLSVKLLDLSGMKLKENITLYSVLGCDIMKLPCHIHDNQRMPLAISQHEDNDKILDFMMTHRNVKSEGVTNVTLEQEYEIDILMKKYDCVQWHLLDDKSTLFSSGQFEILYGTQLWKNLNECDSLLKRNGTELVLKRNEIYTAMKEVLNC